MSDLNKGLKVGYIANEDLRTFSKSANAYQKCKMLVDHFDCTIYQYGEHPEKIPVELLSKAHVESVGGSRLLMPFRIRRKMRSRGESLCCVLFTLHTVYTILTLLLLRIPVVLFCWDPPGILRRNSRKIVDRFIIWLNDRLMTVAVNHSNGLILNLNSSFIERYLPGVNHDKVHHFINGTRFDSIRRIVEGVKPRAKSIGVVSYIAEEKGCWDIVEMFKMLKRKESEAYLYWIGKVVGNDYGNLSKRITDALDGDPLTKGAYEISHGGYDENLRKAAKAQVCFILYKDLPSFRWNHFLKLGEYRAIGRYIVTPDFPGARAYVPRDEVGKCVRLYNSAGRVDFDEFVAAILDGFSKPVPCVTESDKQELDWDCINYKIAEAITT